ncbi:MAG: CapA family protein [bacterium]|nr:CapA family protein [bacterium]
MKKVVVFFLGFVLTVSVGFVSLNFFTLPDRSLISPSLDEITTAAANELESLEPPPYVVYAPLTVDSIFASQKKRTNSADDVVIVATGDIIPARVTNAKMKSKGVGYPFLKIESILKSGDLTVANLEAPLTKNCQVTLEGMTFCGTVDFADSMKRHGVSLVTLENNHINNHGAQGISDTINALESAQLPFSRFDTPYITEIKGQRFGFIPINGVGPAINRALLSERIRDLRNKVDVLIVTVHWGKEYTYDPSSAPGIAPDDPQEIGHLMVDSGADVVFGNHPHWVQGVELYKDAFISYSHGNFIFDQEWSQETKEGVIGSYTFAKGKLVDVSFTPIVIEDFAQPRPAVENEGNKILDAMKMSSVRIMNR